VGKFLYGSQRAVAPLPVVMPSLGFLGKAMKLSLHQHITAILSWLIVDSSRSFVPLGHVQESPGCVHMFHYRIVDCLLFR
jgi:hypothetical protein